MRKIVIIGGGVAGLSAVNRLADLGISAVLIEGGNYPAHKICGEFFSPESAAILKEWGICTASQINRITFTSARSSLSFSIDAAAQSQSRFEFDAFLARRAKEKGALILTNTKVVKIEKGEVHLDSGEKVNYTDLIISAGRFFKGAEPEYMGIKGHLRGLEVENHLEMFSFEGGYAGLSPIGGGLANFACLLKKNQQRALPPLETVFQLAPHLEKRLKMGTLIFNDWMVCPVPPFGIKKRETQENTYFIGDAAGTIPPASGLGLSLALISGSMVADYAQKGDYLGFEKAWKKRFARVFFFGKCLHHLMMSPQAANLGIQLGQLFSSIPPRIFQMTRIGMY